MRGPSCLVALMVISVSLAGCAFADRILCANRHYHFHSATFSDESLYDQIPSDGKHERLFVITRPPIDWELNVTISELDHRLGAERYAITKVEWTSSDAEWHSGFMRESFWIRPPQTLHASVRTDLSLADLRSVFDHVVSTLHPVELRILDEFFEKFLSSESEGRYATLFYKLELPGPVSLDALNGEVGPWELGVKKVVTPEGEWTIRAEPRTREMRLQEDGGYMGSLTVVPEGDHKYEYGAGPPTLPAGMLRERVASMYSELGLSAPPETMDESVYAFCQIM